MTRDGGVAEDDLTLEWCAAEDASGCIDWQPLALTLDGDALLATFGPTGGFAVPDGYDATTLIRATLARSGVYDADVTVRGVDTGTSYATAGHTVTVVEPPPEQECVALFADRTLPVGQVCISADGDELVVTYTTDDGWTLTETHLAVSSDEPGSGQWTDRDHRWQNPQGAPSPGRFPHSQVHDPAAGTTASYTIALADIDGAEPGTTLHLAAHAKVAHLAEERSETAWADGTRFVDRGNWATWFSYTIHQEG